LNKLLGILFLLGTANFVSADSDQHYLEEAKQYLSKGEVKSAIIQLKNLLKDSPGNADARLMLGETYLKFGKIPAAIKELGKARDLGLDKNQWAVPLAQAYLLVGKPKKLLNGFEVNDNDPKPFRAQLRALQGSAHLQLGEVEKARSDFDLALESDPSSSAAFLGKAMLAFLEKDYDKVTEYANKSIENDETNVGALLVLGEMHRTNGQHQDALNAFSKAIDLQPNNPKARVGRALLTIANKNYDSAQKDLDHVANTIGKFIPAIYLQAVIAFQNNKPQEAEDLLLEIVNAEPNHLPSHLLLGSIAYAQNEFESADRYLSGYLQRYPENLPAVKLLAAVKMKLKQPKEALRLLAKFESASETDVQYLVLRGSAYLQNEELDKGTAMLSQAAKLAPDVTEIQTQLALGQIASGDLNSAVSTLESAVDVGSNLMQADMLLVLALIKQQKYDQAIKIADQMKEKEPESPIPTNLIAAAYLAKGDVELAEKNWKKTLTLNPDFTSAALNLAQLETKRNNLDEATNWYEHILKSQPGSTSALIGLAQIAELRKDDKKMVAWIEMARDKNPDELRPILMLARYYLREKKSLRALSITREAYRHHPKNPIVLKTLGFAQVSAGENSSALGTFEKLVKLFPKNPEHHFLLAQALYTENQTEDANMAWDKALELDPTYLPAAISRVQNALREKDYQKSIDLSQAIQKNNAESPIGYQLEGDAEKEMNHLSRAKTLFQKGYKVKQTSMLAQRLFQTHKELGEDASAFAILEDWLEKNEDDLASWTLLALGYQHNGQQNKAIKAYETAYTLDPKNHVVVNNLAWLYQEKGDNKAVDLAEKVLLLAENNPQVADTVGWIFVQNGKPSRGLVLLQQAALQAPHLPEIRIHLAEALIKTGRKNEARKELSRLIEEKKTFPEREHVEGLLRSL